MVLRKPSILKVCIFKCSIFPYINPLSIYFNFLLRSFYFKSFQIISSKLEIILQYAHAELLQSCLTLCGPMDCSPPVFSIHGISQARILEWVAISFLQGIFPTQGSNLSLLCLLNWQVDSWPPGKPNFGLQHEACRILVPWLGTIHWKHGLLTTGPPGNFQLYSKHLLCPSARFYHWHLMIAPLRYNAYTIHLTYWKLHNLTLNKDLFF